MKTGFLTGPEWANAGAIGQAIGAPAQEPAKLAQSQINIRHKGGKY
jgi:hypothetical protein